MKIDNIKINNYSSSLNLTPSMYVIGVSLRFHLP